MKKMLSIILLIALLLSATLVGAQAEEPEWAAKGTPLADVRIRQALAYAIDVDTICETIFEGLATPALSMTPEGIWRAEGLNDYAYNPELAQQLLDEAGWPSDYVLEVVYYYEDNLTAELMLVIQAYWEAVGVQSHYTFLPAAGRSALLWTPPEDPVNGPSVVTWDLCYAAVSALAEHEFYNRYRTGHSNNSSIPSDPALDALIDATNATANVDEQIEAFHALQRYLNETVQSMPLYHQPNFIYVHDRLDTAGSEYGNDQFSYEKDILNWKIDREDNTLYTNSGASNAVANPYTNPGLSLATELLFDKLINADGALKPTDGMLAESYTVSEDGKQIEFALRDGVTWHDGTPFTAEDVQFSIEYYAKISGLNSIPYTTIAAMEGAQAFIDGGADSISGIAIDGNKVIFTFDALDPNATLTFSQWPILPKHLLGESDPTLAHTDIFWQNPVGTGPYKVQEIRLNEYTILERYDAYYRTGEGNVETIYMFPSEEGDPNLITNATAGNIDYAWSKSTDDTAAIEKVEGFNVFQVPARYTRLFYINQFPHDSVNAK